jgi:hypothetical protein
LKKWKFKIIFFQKIGIQDNILLEKWEFGIIFFQENGDLE